MKLTQIIPGRGGSLAAGLGAMMLLLVQGCAAIKPEAMVPPTFALVNRHTGSVSVTVPQETKNPIFGEGHWTSEITAGTFAESLNRALKGSGLFSNVAREQEADYNLNVSFVGCTEPNMALNMTVSLVTKWILTRRATGEDLFRENIATTYTAKLGRAFAGGTRLRLANEGAGRENIQEGIQRLSGLKL